MPRVSLWETLFLQMTCVTGEGGKAKNRHIRFNPLVSQAGRPVPVKFVQLPDKVSGRDGLKAILFAGDDRTPGSANFIASWHRDKGSTDVVSALFTHPPGR